MKKKQIKWQFCISVTEWIKPKRSVEHYGQNNMHIMWVQEGEEKGRKNIWTNNGQKLPKFHEIYESICYLQEIQRHKYLENVLCSVAQSCPSLCDPMDCSLPCSSVYGDSPGKNIGVGCHALLQGTFPTQGSTHCRWILYHLSIAGGFFHIWATSEAHLENRQMKKRLSIQIVTQRDLGCLY